MRNKYRVLVSLEQLLSRQEIINIFEEEDYFTNVKVTNYEDYGEFTMAHVSFNYDKSKSDFIYLCDGIEDMLRSKGLTLHTFVIFV